jgi:hypothetical protein
MAQQASALSAQHAVSAVSAPQRAADPTVRYHRIVALVHLTGSGKHGDPIRPEYVPQSAAGRNGILAWSFQLTDDRKMAIVHMVASNRHAFDAILADARPEIRVFEIGKHSTAEIQGALGKYAAAFDLTQLEVPAQ